MSDAYANLYKCTSDGDEHALIDLVSLAERHVAAREFEAATTIFRDAAIAGSSCASRNRARAEHAEKTVDWLTAVHDLYRQWVADHPRGRRELPWAVPGITQDQILDVVVDDLLHDESFATPFVFLREALRRRGMTFYSPGEASSGACACCLSPISASTPLSGTTRASNPTFPTRRCASHSTPSPKRRHAAVHRASVESRWLEMTQISLPFVKGHL